MNTKNNTTIEAPAKKFEFLADGDQKVKGVINGAGWVEIVTKDDFEELRKIENPSRGTKHVPIQHWNAVQLFGNRLADAGIKIDRQTGLISPNTEKFLFMADVSVKDFPDFNFQLGFINYNDRTRALSVVASEIVMVCSNQCFRYDNQNDKTLRRKHLAGSTDDAILETIDRGIEHFKLFRDRRVEEINRFKSVELDDKKLGNVLLNMHRSQVFGRNPGLISSIFNEFDNPRHEEFRDRTLWNFHNAATEQLKQINVCGRIKTDAELQRVLTCEL